MSRHTQYTYPTQRGMGFADWLLLAFVMAAWAFVMHADHKAERAQAVAEAQAAKPHAKAKAAKPAKADTLEVASK